MQLKSFLWPIPFLCFLLGYFLIRTITHTAQLTTPSLIGKTVYQSTCLLSDMNVNLRVITQKEEADLEEGTILSQTPAAGTKIKAHQSLYVVIAKKPENKKAPSIIRMKKDAIQTLCNKQDMQVKYYNLASNWPKGTCFAQWPPQDHPLDTNQLIAYISSPTNKPIIWPNLKNKPLGDVIAFLQEHGIEPTVTHTYAHAHSQIPPNALVVDQRPLAGTILTLDDSKPLSVQLRVQ